MATSLKYVNSFRVPPALIYRAFTNATALREWLCDTATVDPRPGGRFFIAWNSGYYASGEFTKLQPDREVQFIWQGRDDPGPSHVRVLINLLDNGVCMLTLEHFDLEKEHAWASAFKQIDAGWNLGLGNLLSTLENGPDLRIVNRPMMGLGFGDFDKKRAIELDVPVERGMRIDTVVDGMGGHAAGLRKNDVVVEIDGKSAVEYPSVIAALQHRQAGDVIEVGFYRGPIKKKTKMQLSRRAIPEIPMTPAGLADELARCYAADWVRLAQILTGVSEQDASLRPAQGEWTVKEIVAHLLHNERDIQSAIQDLYFSEERVTDGFAGNLDARVQATVSAYETLERLLDAYQRSQAETVELLRRLPDDFLQQKGSFWRLGFRLLQFNTHTQEHSGQISLAVAAVRH